MHPPNMNRSQIITLFSLFFSLLIFNNVFAQHSDNFVKVRKALWDLSVDSFPDSAARHMIIDTTTFNMAEAGYYRVYLKCLYSGESQANEHFFMTVSANDTIRTPLDSNLGLIKVLRDTLEQAGAAWRNTGLFYFSPTDNFLVMHHYNAMFTDLSYRNLVHDVDESELYEIVIGDSISIKQSVHVDSLIIVGEPRFSHEFDVTKTDSLFDFDNSHSLTPGDIIEYTIQIRNSGTGSAHNVFLTDSIPTNTSYIDGSINITKGSVISTSPILRIDVGTLASSTSEIITISYQVRVAVEVQSIRNQGFIHSDEIIIHPTDDPNTEELDDPTYTSLPDFSGETDITKQDQFFDNDNSGTLTPGDIIEYVIQITNSGSGEAHHVVFADSIPQSTSYVSGSATTSKGIITSTDPIFSVDVGTIAPSKSEVVIIGFQVEIQTEINVIRNQGYLDCDETKNIPTDDPDTETPDDPTYTKLADISAESDVLKLDQFIDSNGDGNISPGDYIDYTIIIKNSSSIAALNVVFTDTIPTHSSYVENSLTTSKGTILSAFPIIVVQVGNIAPEEREIVTISFRVIITENVDQVSNQGFLGGDNIFEHPTDDPDTEDENDPTITQLPNFNGKSDVLKQDFFFDTDASSSLTPSDSITYLITVKNSGYGMAHDVVFSDSIPKHTQYISGSAKTTKGIVLTTSPILTVNIGSIAPRESEIIYINFKVIIIDSTGEVRNQGFIDSRETDPQPTDNPETLEKNDETITRRPNFRGKDDVIKAQSFSDVDNSGSITPGDIIAYTIDITNSGAKIANNVTFTDTIPDFCSFITNSATTSKGSIVSTSPIFIVNIGTIAANKSEIVTIKFSVSVTQAVNQIENQGQVSADDISPEPTDDPESTIINDETKTQAPNFNGRTDVLKRSRVNDIDANRLLSTGDIITYTISIQNSGLGVAHHVVFTDSIPQFTNFVAGSATTTKGLIETTTPVLKVNIGNIASAKSEIVVVSFQVTVTQAVERISNQGFVSSDEVPHHKTDDPKTEDNNDPTIDDNTSFYSNVKISQFAITDSFTVNNNDTTKFVKQGETYTIFIRLENISNNTAINLLVQNSIPDSVLISNITPVENNISNSLIIWNLDSLQANSIASFKFDAQVKPDMPVGYNYLINHVSVSCVNENPNLLSDNVCADTVFNQITPLLFPEIEASPARIDVTDSIMVRIKVPPFRRSQDVWIHFPDGHILKTFADNFLATTSITPEVWYPIDEVFHPNYLVTNQKEEQLIFEIRTIDNENREANAQAIITVSSSNYLVLERNVFKPELENTLGIRFKLSTQRMAKIDAYDLTGKHITKIAEDIFQGGWNTYNWNGRCENGQKAGSGVYIITLRSGEFSSWKKVIIVK